MTPRGAEVVAVVGDRFEGIARLDGVLTLTELLRLAEDEPEVLPRTIVIGQGVNGSDLAELSTVIEESGHVPRPEIRHQPLNLVSRSASHKRRSQNVLVANLRSAGTLTTTADLRLENDNELLLDHQTGQHVQGMVVVEASRQMFLASTHCLRLIDGLQDPYFVIASMATEFHSFLFPLPASLRFETTEPDRSRPESAGFVAVIEIEQNGVSVSTTRVGYTVFAGARIHQIESKKAEGAVNAQIPRRAAGADRA
ncbi:AfsA-related hotdog domain-containing protein [Sanguibacter sp. Leaf3]|uniref:AfsA-related hotdog domain-containing protein n=1 Tax=Sanguibacter sp. Leaf3 TaxID=1736209 RepID=UPI0006F7FA59|nr:AfsA-related hotdog domain-containing protein [Sanguibacter sp. Leaf3]KQU00381.1 hypothetical protein ASG53_06055 [Sanguibacter sp. Leaf3]